MLLVCIRMYFYVTRMLLVCYSCVIRMYPYVTRMLLVCIRMLLVCIRIFLVVLVWSFGQHRGYMIVNSVRRRLSEGLLLWTSFINGGPNYYSFICM